jgi:hypothetical protein
LARHSTSGHVVYWLSDKDIGVTREDPTATGNYRPGWTRRSAWSTAGSAPRGRFGYAEDHGTRLSGKRWPGACAVLLGGGTISGVMREWTKAGVRPVHSKTVAWSRQSIRTILMNPRIAGLSVYNKGEIVGTGDWEPLVSDEAWRAVRGMLEDPSREPPNGVRTVLAGLALCPCGNVMVGMPSHTGHHIYRCARGLGVSDASEAHSAASGGCRARAG